MSVPSDSLFVLPEIEGVLPHSGEMRFLDRLLAADGLTLTAEYRVRADAWYCNAHAAMPAWIGIEVMAQAVAAHVALEAMRDGGRARLGVLLGTRSYLAHQDEFAAGSVLRIEVCEVFRTEGGHRAYECAISAQEPAQAQKLAQAVIKVLQPDDFNEFIKGSVIR